MWKAKRMHKPGHAKQPNDFANAEILRDQQWRAGKPPEA
jgi:hypothetical protein